ncbi:hypothetical protein V1527DRAFT_478379 [Lipomyces starkeyi]
MSTVTVLDDNNLSKVGPPNTRRSPGRPQKKMTRTEDIGIPSKKLTCSRCHKQLGHNAATCNDLGGRR